MKRGSVASAKMAQGSAKKASERINLLRALLRMAYGVSVPLHRSALCNQTYSTDCARAESDKLLHRRVRGSNAMDAKNAKRVKNDPCTGRESKKEKCENLCA